MGKHQKHVKHDRKNWAGIFAAVFAVTVVVATQIGGSDSQKFLTDATSDAQMQAGCVAAGGTWMGITANPPCNMPTTTTAPTGYAAFTCPNGTSFPAGTGTAPTCPTAPTCTSPQYLDTSTNTCKSPAATVGSCTSAQYWDAATSTCKPTTAIGTCSSGQYWNGNACVNNSTTTAGASSFITEPTCNGAHFFWSWSKNACYSTQAEKTAAEVAAGSTVVETVDGCKAKGMGWDAARSMCTGSATMNSAYSFTTQAACTSAAYFWSTTKFMCFSTQAEKTAAEGGTANASWPSVQKVWNNLGLQSMICSNAPATAVAAAVAACANSTMSQITWPNSSDCSRPETAGIPVCGGGEGTKTVDTVGACTSRSGSDGKPGTWNAATSTCSVPMNYFNTTTNSNWVKTTWSFKDGQSTESYILNRTDSEYANHIAKVRAACLLVNKTNNWNPGAGNDTDWRNFGIPSCGGTSTGTAETVDGCRAKGMGWDAARSMCTGSTNTMTEWDMPAGTCPNGTAYPAGRYSMTKPACQMDNTNTSSMDDGCRKAGGTWLPGMSGGMGYCKMQVDLTAVNNMNARMQAECVAKKGTWNSGPTETATGWCRMERMMVDQAVENCGQNAYWDFNLQSCQVSPTKYDRKDQGMNREAARMSAMFGNQLKYISRDIQQSRTRAEDAAAEGADVSEALGYLDRADEIIADMMDNIQNIASSGDPRSLFEPECMSSFANVRDSSFGGSPERMCTIEEALKGDTPRGYIYAANTLMDDEQKNYWESQMCTEISKRMAEFQRMFAKSKTYKAEVESLLVDGNKLVSACEDAKDKSTIMPAMDALRMRAESLMRRASTKSIDPAYGLKFSGVDQQMDEATFNRVVALVEQKITARLTKVIEERMSALASNMDANTLSKVTAMFTAVKADIAEKLSSSFENAAVFAASAPDAVNKQQGYTVDIINTLKTIETVYPDSADRVEAARNVIASRPWPVSTLAGYKDRVDSALADANEDKDPAKSLEKIIRDGNGANEKQINQQLSRDGLWAFPDVKHDVWYAAAANEAATLGVVQGTENAEGYKDLRPEVQLNCAEGIAMIDKAAGLSLTSEAGEGAKKLAGSVDWAGPFVQSAIDIIGEDGVKNIINRCGGIGGAMRRDAFAHLAVAVWEKIEGGEVQVDVDTEIAQYTDFGEMNDEQKLDFAKAHKLGIITGADGGTRANAKGFANRAEAAKMLTVLNKGLAAVKVVAGADEAFPNTGGN